MDHEHIVRSLKQAVYNRNLINNAERGTYVEHMIFLALKGKGWDLTWPWASWDLEHLRWPKEKRPRIEVKQSAARAPDHAEKRPNPPPETPARFSIKLRKYYYLRDGTLVKTPLRRHADLYVFAWHPEADLNIADHRCPDQWKFFVVAESELPTPPDPPPKNMSIRKSRVPSFGRAPKGAESVRAAPATRRAPPRPLWWGCGSRRRPGPPASEARDRPLGGGSGWRRSSRAGGASTTDVMLAGNWKTSRMVAHYSAGATAERGAVARYL